MKKLLSIVLALSLCLTAMMGCFVVSAETTNKVTVETVKIMPETATTEVDIAFDFDDYFAASKFTVDFTGLALAAIDYDETVVSIAHGATDGDVDVFDGITSLTCILDAVNAEDLGAFTDVVITLTFDTADLTANNYAITFTGDVAHAGTYDPDTGWTGDEDIIDYTATAGAIHVHTVVVDEAVDADCVNTGLTEGSHCSACEEVLVAQTETPATGEHNYVDGVCSVCGDEEEEEIVKFNIAGANMNLGNELSMNFMFAKSNVTGTDNYAVITKTYADGRANAVVTIPQAAWGSYGSTYHMVTFNGVAAKEMGDELYVVVYNSNGDEISNQWTDSVVGYVSRLFNNQSNLVKIMFADMINYGAAAQTFFGYDTDNLVTDKLTAEQLAYATSSVDITNNRVQGTNYFASNLNLEGRILLNLFFNNITTDMYAKVSYTDYLGRSQSYTVDGADFITVSGYLGVEIDTLATGDGYQLVTVEIYDSNDELVATGADSVESYCSRQTTNTGFYTGIMKFVESARNYLIDANS